MGLTWLALGDSITAGTGASATTNAYVFRTRAALQGAAKDHYLINAGVGGYRSDEIKAHFTTLRARTDADLITILCGTNDISQGVAVGTFQTNLSDLVDAIQARKYGGRGTIVLCSILWRNDANNAQVASFNSAIQTVATAQGVTFCNTNPAFSTAAYLADAVHPNNAGHQAVADILAPALSALSVWSNPAQRPVT